MPDRKIALVFAAIAVVTVVAYVPSLRGGFIWDDDAHVTHSRVHDSVDGLVDIWLRPGSAPQYYPMAHTAFWLQRQAFGDNPLGYKLVNLGLHLAGSGLLILILMRLGFPAMAAALAGAIFALHPVHVESVAWISELKNTLSTCLYLAAAWCYLRWREPEGDARLYGSALALFTAAVLSKTVAASWPAAMLVVAWWQRGRITRDDVRPLVPFFLIGVSFGLVTVWFERTYVGATGEDFAFTLADRVLIAGRAAWFYAWKLLWPAELVFIYPRWTIDPGEAWQWLFAAAAAALLAGLVLLSRRRWRGPLAAVLFFGGTLVPALGFFNVFPFVYSFVADHFQYLASIGLIALFAGGVGLAARRWPAAHASLSVACVLLLAALAARTYAQGHVYRDLESLWRHVIAHNPGSWMAWNNLGGVLRGRGELAEARAMFERSVELNPRNAAALRNLGELLDAQGRDDEALALFERAIRIEPTNALAINELGELYRDAGDTQRAAELFEQAVKANPRHAGAWYNLAILAVERGHEGHAIDCLRRAIAAQENLSLPHYQLGQLLLKRGQTAEAIEHLRRAVEIRPNLAEARLALGQALSQTGDSRGAIAQFEKAIEADPDLGVAHYNLSQMLAGAGRIDEAIAAANEAARVDPTFGEAHFFAAYLMRLSGRYPLDAMVAKLKAALAARPDLAAAEHELGGVLFRAGHRRAGLEHLRKAVALDPKQADYRADLGEALLVLGEGAAGRAELAEAVALRPDFNEARLALARAMVDGGLWDEAARELEELTTRGAPDAAVLRLQADVYLHLGRRGEARSSLARLLEVRPDSGEALRDLAWLVATDPDAAPTDIVAAVAMASRAVKLRGGEDPRALDALAAAHAAARQFSDAIRVAQRAVALASAADNAALAEQIALRIERYRAGERWIETH